MTTIAYDGHSVAADSQVSRGDSFSHYESKVRRVKGSGLIIGSGECQAVIACVEWLSGGGKPERLDGFHGLYIKRDGVFEINDKPVLDPVLCPMAIGSGWQYALVAMDLGKSAREAVECAAGRDLFTGGDIEVVKVCDVVSSLK